MPRHGTVLRPEDSTSIRVVPWERVTSEVRGKMCVWVPAGQIDDAERRQEVPKDGVQNAEFRRDRLHVDSASGHHRRG
jgi:hypothetical protein